MTPTLRSLLALGALIAVGLGGFELWNLASEPSRPPSSASADDDLALLEAMGVPPDASAPHLRSLLAVREGRSYRAHGSEGVVEMQVSPAASATALARLGQPVEGLAVAGDAVWVTAGHAVRRLSPDGGAAVVTEALTRPRAIAADGSSVVVVDLEPTTPGLLRASRVVRLPASPNVPASALTVLGHYQGEVTNVVLDHGTAYWADPLEGDLLAASADEAGPRVLAGDRGLPGAVVVAGDALVWVEQRGEALWAVAKSGGEPRQLVQDFAGFAHVVARGRRVDWVNEAAVDGTYRVLEVSLDGGGVVALSPPVESIEALGSDGQRLYWMRDGVVAEVGGGD